MYRRGAILGASNKSASFGARNFSAIRASKLQRHVRRGAVIKVHRVYKENGNARVEDRAALKVSPTRVASVMVG